MADLRTTLAGSLAALEVEFPDLGALMVERVPGIVSLRVGEEELALVLECGRLRLESEGDRDGPAVVDVRVSKETILALAGGQTSIEEATVSGDLHVAGAAPDLCEAYDALLLYIEGVARSPGGAARLRSYREDER